MSRICCGEHRAVPATCTRRSSYRTRLASRSQPRCGRRDLGPDTTAALLLEARLALDEVANVADASRELLNREARAGQAVRRVHSAAEADYMRALMHPAGGRADSSGSAVVALPMRLLARARPLNSKRCSTMSSSAMP
jgi:hypothetical protein